MERKFVKFMFAFSLIVFVWITLFSKQEFIESENRTAAKFSLFSPDGYFTDCLPLRDSLMRINRDISLAMGKNEFSGAFFGKNGYIFSNEEGSIQTLEKNLLAVEDFSKLIDTKVCIVPSKTDALISLLPRFFESGRGELWQRVSDSCGYVADAFSTLRLAGANGKYIYYRGDHHLTSLGSYYLYKSLASALGIVTFGAEDFSVSIVKNNFSGSDARKMLTVTDDKITLFRYKGDGDFTVENCDAKTSYKGLYNYGKLNSNDPYGVFPLPDCGHVRITHGEGRETVLIVCDSYGDSLAPFLARHFDLDIIDPRYFGGSVKELIGENNYTAALVCFGIDTLAGKEILYKLKV